MVHSTLCVLSDETAIASETRVAFGNSSLIFLHVLIFEVYSFYFSVSIVLKSCSRYRCPGLCWKSGYCTTYVLKSGFNKEQPALSQTDRPVPPTIFTQLSVSFIVCQYEEAVPSRLFQPGSTTRVFFWIRIKAKSYI